MNELVVYRIVRALYALICSQDRFYGMRFVAFGGIQARIRLFFDISLMIF